MSGQPILFLPKIGSKNEGKRAKRGEKGVLMKQKRHGKKQKSGGVLDHRQVNFNERETKIIYFISWA